MRDQLTFVHPSSVNNRKYEVKIDQDSTIARQIYAYAEKRRNTSVATNGSPMTFLSVTTRLDPMTYVLFGAHKLEKLPDGLKCDGWIRIVGSNDALEDIYRLRTMMDACMLRVYEGIIMSRRRQRRKASERVNEDETNAWEDDDDNEDYSLSSEEMKELDLLSNNVVDILNRYSEERLTSESRPTSRPATPSDLFSSRLRPAASSHATPYGSRSGTPLGRPRRF